MLGLSKTLYLRAPAHARVYELHLHIIVCGRKSDCYYVCVYDDTCAVRLIWFCILGI